MSSSGRPTGAVNVVRRTWDKEEFEKRAKERAEREAAGVRSDDEDEGRGRGGRVDGGAGGAGAGAGAGDAFRQAAAGAAGPEGSKRAFLSARTEELSLEANLNKRKLVTDATPTGAHGGYHCDVCDCTLKDSTAYLDHINGKRHQRKLGYSMRVEKSSVDAVRARLAAAKQTQHGQKCAADEEAARREALQEYEQRIAEQEEEERRRRKRARTEGQHDAGISSRPVAAASNDAAPPAAANGQWKSDSTSTSGGGHGGTGAQGDAHAGAGAGAAPKQQQPAQAAPLPETVLQGDEAAEMAALLGFSGFT